MRLRLWALLACAAVCPCCVLDTSGLSGGGSGSCPGRAGPAAVRIAQGASSFCIDSTEVTNEQYRAFLDATRGLPSGLPAVCSFKTSHAPSSSSGSESGRERFPVVDVDWCDALAYCLWAGKALCGRPQGGAHAISERNDANASAWFAACSKGGTRAFAYGDAYERNTCNTSSSSPFAVGSLATCEGGYPEPGVFDLSGNVEEWTDSCEAGSDPAQDGCLARGGSFSSEISQGECASTTDAREARSLREPWRGFRCCGYP